MSLEECLGQDKDGNDVELADIIPADDEEVLVTVENNVISQKILKLINTKLSQREAEIIKLRYGIGGQKSYTQREVAQKLNISRSYISRLETKAIDIIKNEVQKDNFFK